MERTHDMFRPDQDSKVYSQFSNSNDYEKASTIHYSFDNSSKKLVDNMSLNLRHNGQIKNDSKPFYFDTTSHLRQLSKDEANDLGLHKNLNEEPRPRRSLQFNDATMSIISGSGIQDNIIATQEQTIIVDPRGSDNLTWGSEQDIYIQISNQCTYNSSHFS